MKKFKSISLALCLLLAGSLMFAGCNSHVHTYSDSWDYNTSYHWHAATCSHTDEVSNYEEHTLVTTYGYGTGKDDSNVYYEILSCSVCDYQTKTPVTAVSTYNALVQALGEASKVVLVSDIAMTNTSNISISREVVLDLNGHTLTFASLTSGYTGFTANGNSAVLTIADTAGTGKIYSNSYGVGAAHGGTVVVTGGEFITYHSCLASNNLEGIANFTVTGGTFSSLSGAASIYYPNQGQLLIAGGTFNSGVSVRMGQVTITGGTFYSFNTSRYTELVEDNYYDNYQYDAFSEYYNFNGNVFFGNALTIYVGTYTSSDETYGNSLNLSITGGTFVNDNNSSSNADNTVQIYIAGNVQQTANISITGGTFTSEHGTDISIVEASSSTVDQSSFPNTDYYNEGTNKNSINLTVSDNLFSADISAYLDEE